MRWHFIRSGLIATYWVVEICAKDTLPNGAYRLATIVAGPYSVLRLGRRFAQTEAEAEARNRNAQVAPADRDRTGRVYLAWSDEDMKAARERGTAIIGRAA